MHPYAKSQKAEATYRSSLEAGFLRSLIGFKEYLDGGSREYHGGYGGGDGVWGSFWGSKDLKTAQIKRRSKSNLKTLSGVRTRELWSRMPVEAWCGVSVRRLVVGGWWHDFVRRFFLCRRTTPPNTVLAWGSCQCGFCPTKRRTPINVLTWSTETMLWL